MQPMNLWKHKSGSWHIWLNRSEHPPAGKRMSLRKIAGHTVYDKAEAEEYLKELKRNWHKQKIVELQVGTRHSIKTFATNYIEGRSHLSESTTRMDEMALRFFVDAVGDVSIELIRKKHINQFVGFLKARKVTPKSINSYLRHVRAAYNSACELYDIRPIKIKLLKVGKTLPRILTKDEIDKILTYAKEHDYEMWRIINFSVKTGCRRSEILQLTWGQVGQDYIKIKGKGKKDRIIPIRNLSDLVGRRKDIGNIFSRIHKDTVSKRFHAICTKIGIDAKFHSLRHSAATYMIESGMHPKAVQAILGHEDFRTTELYVNIHNEWISEEMEKFKI